MKVTCFTSATFAYLDRARVLARTVREHHPDWWFAICLPDVPPAGVEFDIEDEPFDQVVTIEDIGYAAESGWTFEHDVVELCTAVKGPSLEFLLDQGADRVVYLDPDIAVFSPLDEVLDLLEQRDVVLTPHQIEPAEDRHEILDNEIASLKHGVYNLGFVAVANRDEGRRFARWWGDRLRAFCFDEIDAGLFTDQRWCDLAPAFFPSLTILRHPGYNVASWNLAHRPMAVGPDGAVTAAGEPLRFFHFTKVNALGEQMIERYSGGTTVPLELMWWYRRQLEANAVPDLEAGYWYYGTFADGEQILRHHRRTYRDDVSLHDELPAPFELTRPQFESLTER